MTTPGRFMNIVDRAADSCPRKAVRVPPAFVADRDRVYREMPEAA